VHHFTRTMIQTCPDQTLIYMAVLRRQHLAAKELPDLWADPNIDTDLTRSSPLSQTASHDDVDMASFSLTLGMAG
jgi:hypothetical protein